MHRLQHGVLKHTQHTLCCPAIQQKYLSKTIMKFHSWTAFLYLCLQSMTKLHCFLKYYEALGITMWYGPNYYIT